jgi:hypothetical protein
MKGTLKYTVKHFSSKECGDDSLYHVQAHDVFFTMLERRVNLTCIARQYENTLTHPLIPRWSCRCLIISGTTYREAEPATCEAWSLSHALGDFQRTRTRLPSTHHVATVERNRFQILCRKTQKTYGYRKP